MVRHAVGVEGDILYSKAVWQNLYQFQILWTYGAGWIGREKGGLPASAHHHMFLAEASARSAARAIE
eukprot:3120359-Alexandrium_andersonii.AAC.1